MPDWLPRRVSVWGLLLVLLASPASVVAQTESAKISDQAEAPAASGGKPGGGLLDLDIEQLARTPVVVPSMDQPVTSVAKEASTVGRSAAAVFVITSEMIRRSGAMCIPDALRMAPGVEVAQANSNTWAITIRGFNSTFSGKLLVLIDGRSVYNPDFSGVYWNMQDVLLEDVERIEVVRGPGGTLWGSNAVNGVINIITKRAKDTQGAYVMAGGGSHQQLLDGVRYGGQIGEDCHYRVYGKQFEIGPDFDPTGRVDDSWRQGEFGFRADWEPDRDKSNIFTIQGDHFVGSTNNSIIPTSPALPENQNGENMLARWRHIYSDESDWTLQAYYDCFMRNDSMQTEQVRTWDVDFQYRFPLMDRHNITCGAGFRNVESYYPGGDTFTTYFPTPYYTTNFPSQFVQDEISLVDKQLVLTVGTKIEENPYTGFEYQPTARLLWAPDQRHSIWGAVSRAVRTPSRAQRQLSMTLAPYAPGYYPRAMGNPYTMSEAMLAYEVGYRVQETDAFSWDIAVYYDVYDPLQGVTPGMPTPEMDPAPPHMVVPLYMNTDAQGQAYGVEIFGNYAVSERWRLYAEYSLLSLQANAQWPQSTEYGNDPRNQVYLRSAWDLREDLEFDMMARYVDNLPQLYVPAYITMDLRLAWRPRKHLEVALVGQNLLQQYHWEYAGDIPSSPTYATEVPRGVYSTLTYRR